MSISLVPPPKPLEPSTLALPTPSLYAQYLLERVGTNIIENDKGFATYYFLSDGLYAVDVYVKPEFRRTDVATKFGDQLAEIAKAKGFKKMYGSVRPSTNGSTNSMKFLLAYGFQLLEAGPDAIMLVKGLV